MRGASTPGLAGERIRAAGSPRLYVGLGVAIAAAVLVSGCQVGDGRRGGEAGGSVGGTLPSWAPGSTGPDAATSPPVSSSASTASTGVGPAGVENTAGRASVVDVDYRVERRARDSSTANFEGVVDATLSDGRGWARAGFRLVRRKDAPFLIVLGEAAVVDRLCLPYDTFGLYSCQNGPVVAINADRWRTATPEWTGDLATYRQMLVNHEVGHLLGQRHPARQCPEPGRAAAAMAQQSTELRACLPNPWPLAWEVDVAARHDLPLAPPSEP